MDDISRRWHSIPGHPGLIVSEDGRVRSQYLNEDAPVAKTLFRRRRFILVNTEQGHYRVYLDDMIELFFGDDK